MIRVSSFGEVNQSYCRELIKRIQRLIPFDWTEIKLRRCPDQRPPQLLPEEKKFLEQNRNFHLLDIRGKALNDDEFYKLCFSNSEVHFVIGPAIGFHPDFYAQSLSCIQLSSLTLTHGLAQSLLAESVYRAACRLKNHPFVK